MPSSAYQSGLHISAADVRRITSVYVFTNEMVITFDQHGEQMPDYQGHRDDVLDRIRAVYTGEIVTGLQWRAPHCNACGQRTDRHVIGCPEAFTDGDAA